ncbi:MAG: bifunctional glutamate N-acetyltransferase/amino-acid acetyltransferase ArgJ [Ignavibacteriaceae bacterium]|nr:bifunctional glutamate N-acetyltransferase/amino-acid acetyltransferase ArgJ [Ignavibacteriaceae bacterium]
MYQFIENGTVTSVQGFKAAGIHCGLKKKKPDLALIYSEVPCNAAGTFTLNKVKAAPILISQKIIQKKNQVRAILVNSGNANACTGEQGHKDAIEIQEHCAKILELKPNEVLVSSTGVIGQPIPVDKIIHGINEIKDSLTSSGGHDAAEAIMTTDLREKSFALKIKLTGGEVRIGGICKGSGMIMPNMATMLAFITTDANIEQALLQEMLLHAVNKTFNKITVDGDTSTNDMVILLANGLSGISVKKDSVDYNLFLKGLNLISEEMAKSIIVDGEGATKLIRVTVHNAKTSSDADTIAKSIANSPLVKTALNGADANWGRIISAAGKSGADFDPLNTMIYFDELPIMLAGYKIVIDEVKAAEILNRDNFSISLDLNEGNFSSTWWTCDFSQEYIKINANYRT